MAMCPPPTPVLPNVGPLDVTADILNTVVQLIFLERILDAQEDYADAMSAFAETAVEKAKTAFESSYTNMRAKDEGVFAEMKSIPLYAKCDENVDRGFRTGIISGNNLMKLNIGSKSRYNCGDREQALLDSLSAGIIASGEGAANAQNTEEALCTAYFRQRYTTMAASSARQQLSGISNFGDSANVLIQQVGTFSQAAYNAATGLVSTFGMYSRGRSFGSNSNDNNALGNSSGSPFSSQGAFVSGIA